ncbi:MAG: sulfatase [bacterium]
MRNLRKRIRGALRRKRQDIFLSSALYVLISALVALKGPFVVTLFRLRLPALSPHSPALPLTLILVFCLLLPKYVNMKRVLLLFGIAALAHLLFFKPGSLTDDQPHGKTPATEIETSVNRNLLIISIGNLRPDRMSGYGAVRNTSMHIDRLAAGSLMFTSAYTNVPSAAAAHATLFTGLHAAAHGVSDAPFAPLKDGAERRTAPTLAELMRRGGWRTEAVIERGALPPAFNLDQGFDRYDTTAPDLPAAVALAVRRLEENRGEKLFMFFHTASLAPPFNPPAPYHTAYSPGYKGKLGYVVGLDDFLPINSGNLEPTPADEEHILALYDAELLYADVQLGRLLRHLRSSGLMERSVIVLLSDHGETLGEHGAYGDARRSLHEEALRIPLIISIPGVRRRSVDLRVSLVDVMPSLLDLFGIPPGGEFWGESIFALLSKTTGEKTGRAVFAETERGQKKAIIAGRYKFIMETRPETPAPRFNTAQNLFYFIGGRELYDLRSDPRERNNLVRTDSPRARAMEKLLNKTSAKARGGGPQHN